MHHGHADTVTFPIQQSSVNIIIVIGIIHKDESKCGIDVNDNQTKHSRHQQLTTILGHRSDDTLQFWESVDNVNQMERVKDRWLDGTLNRKCKIDYGKHKTTILQKVTQTDPFVFKINSSIVKVQFSIFVLECWNVRTLGQQQYPSSLQWQILHTYLSKFRL